MLVSATLLLASLLVVHADSGSRVSGPAASQLRSATAYYDSVIARTRDESAPERVSASTAIALGYLERLRLGIGSPFRLVDFALADTRLAPATQQRLAWALLGRLRRGDAYVVSADATRGLHASLESSAPSPAHLALIQRTVHDAADPRAGELAVRLAYALAAGERTISERGATIATQIAALARDRALADRDLRALLDDCAAQGLDPLDELERRRRERAFAVEAPSALPLDETLQTEAMRDVPRLLQSVRDIERAEGRDSSIAAPSRAGVQTDLLGVAAARRLYSLGAELPPDPAIAVTARLARRAGFPAGAAPRTETSDLARLNAEMLVARRVIDRAGDDSSTAVDARVLVAVATAARAEAQQPPWFPGMPAPTDADLRADYGVAGISFEPDVPAAWRPYYRSLIAGSIADAQRVLAGFSVDGLHFRVALDGLPDTVLALHDPRTRTIRLSAVSSAGALAHELAHDLDWQAARRLYNSGGYSTDHAMRERRGALASSMRDLAAARITRRNEVAAERPAEVFARNVDWLVAMSLAREGRSNGELTAIQDAAITGYTTVSPVAMVFGAARPLVDAVEEMTYLPDPVRRDFLDQWGDPRTVDPYLLVRYVLALGAPRRIGGMLPQLFAGDELLFAGARSRLCAGGEARPAPELRARQELLELALASHAMGIARQRASYYVEGEEPAWAKSLLGRAPFSAQPGIAAVARVRSALALQLDGDRGADQLRFVTPAMFSESGAATCDR